MKGIMIMGKMMTMNLTADNAIAAVTKLNPEDGDILFFYIKTD